MQAQQLGGRGVLPRRRSLPRAGDGSPRRRGLSSWGDGVPPRRWSLPDQCLRVMAAQGGVGLPPGGAGSPAQAAVAAW